MKAMLKGLAVGNFRVRNDAAGLLRPCAPCSRYPRVRGRGLKPQHSSPSWKGCRPGGGQAAAVSPEDRGRADSLGPADAYRLLRREGWLVNHKRLHGLLREEGLQHLTLRREAGQAC